MEYNFMYVDQSIRKNRNTHDIDAERNCDWWRIMGNYATNSCKGYVMRLI